MVEISIKKLKKVNSNRNKNFKSMKIIQTKAGELLLVKVPELAFYFDWKIKSGFDESIIIYYETEDGRMGHIETDLLAWNKFEIIGKFSELEDKDFEEFVERDPRDSQGFVDYLFYKEAWYRDAKESFKSLCKSSGIEDGLDNYLIIKKL